jgi:hypothetical protein
MSTCNAKNALQVLLEYSVPLLMSEPRQNAERQGDETAYRITPFGKEYLVWAKGNFKITSLDASPSIR